MFDFKQAEDEEDGEAPARSILGLGQIEPTPFSVRGGGLAGGGDPPRPSLLGLEGLSVSPLRRVRIPGGTDGQPPNPSILSLTSVPRGPLPRAEKGVEAPGSSILGLVDIGPSSLPPVHRVPRRRRSGESIAASLPARPEAWGPSFFGLGGSAPGGGAGFGGEPASRSFFGLEALPYGVGPSRQASRGALEPIDVPEFERDVEHRAEPAFPIERAILISLLAHVAILLLLIFAPAGVGDPRKGLLAAFVPPEKSDEEKIPLVFKEAPGPARENPKKSAPSDADRRAGGGDRSKPRADSPFVPDRPGKEGLRPGLRRPASPPPAPPAGSALRPTETKEARNAPSPGQGKSPETANPTEGALLVPQSPSGATSASPGGRAEPTLQGLKQAIREAARGVGEQGEGGSGFPNPGGFVDSGPLSFDTNWYDWGPYAAEMIRRIKLHWDVPEIARLGMKGKLTIRFFIMADGTVQGATYLAHSEVPPFDNAAMQAILTSNPFRPLPKDLLEQVPGKDREGITVTFFYNMRPGETGSGAPN